MNVIRHDHVATNGDIEAGFGTFGKNGERRMNFVASEKRFSLVGAKSDEIQRARVKQATETWRAAPEILLHEEPCSHGPAGRTFFVVNSRAKT
jgi:hypothetical protein